MRASAHQALTTVSVETHRQANEIEKGSHPVMYACTQTGMHALILQCTHPSHDLQTALEAATS